MGGSMFSILILVLLFGVMYFLMIRPQKKREKETNAMRAGVQVGDEIVTIGGICCKVVKTKEETIVVQAGPDKVKMELMRWAVSKIIKEGSGRIGKTTIDDYDEVAEAEQQEVRKSKPKRMKKAAVVEVADETEEAPNAVEEAPEKAEEVAENADVAE